MAELTNIKSPVGVQEQQLQFLANSLAAKRKAETADVIMVCGERVFYAHKLILEANSPYFTTMLQSSFADATSGKIVYNEMEPETLDAILDFMYLGDVKKMKTEDQFMKVLAASHMMLLQNLFHHCSNSLSQMLSQENFLIIWEVAERYEAAKLLSEVKSYFLKNCTQILASKYFLTITANQLQQLAVVYKSKFRNLDKILKVIVVWVRYDLPVREKFTNELFSYIDANRINMQYAKCLMNDCKQATISKELCDRLKQLTVEICLAEVEGSPEEADKIETSLNDCRHKLVFLMQQKNTTRKSCQSIDTFVTHIQMFDLGNLAWEPMTQLPFVNFKVDAICQYNSCLFMVGSTAGDLHVLYDMKSNISKCVNTNHHCSPNDTACHFKNAIYLIGGNVNEATKQCKSFCLQHSSTKWVEFTPLNISRCKPVLFTSDKYLFVVGGTSPLDRQIVEYTEGFQDYWNRHKMIWNIAELPNVVSVDVCFFLYKNDQLHGLYNFNDRMLKLTFNNGTWNVQEFPKNSLYNQLKVESISKFPTEENPFIFISTVHSITGTPDYTLEMESFKWTKLPQPKGQRGINKCDILLKTSWQLPQ